ncbi:MAG: response regulator transcription factor [Rikenellaceae bacterium]|nr:response regulator transcription factor [Rikenellaceae bacterium]
MPRILVIEDETRVADTIVRGLAEFGHNAQAADSAERGLEMLSAGRYDIIICDVMLPGISGFEAIAEIRRIYGKIPVIMLTALGTTDDKLEGFDAGADDYMVKPFDLRELNARVGILLKRVEEKECAKEEIAYGGITIDLRMKSASREGVPLKLTPKEFNLLQYMAGNPERILTRAEIAEKVWGTTFDTGTNFIDVYINYLRKKVDRDFGTKLIHTKPGVGFILSDKYENKE